MFPLQPLLFWPCEKMTPLVCSTPQQHWKLQTWVQIIVWVIDFSIAQLSILSNKRTSVQNTKSTQTHCDTKQQFMELLNKKIFPSRHSLLTWSTNSSRSNSCPIFIWEFKHFYLTFDPFVSIAGDIIFNARYPELPPDFIFGEDAEFLPEPSELPVSIFNFSASPILLLTNNFQNTICPFVNCSSKNVATFSQEFLASGCVLSFRVGPKCQRSPLDYRAHWSQHRQVDCAVECRSLCLSKQPARRHRGRVRRAASVLGIATVVSLFCKLVFFFVVCFDSLRIWRSD